MQRLQELDDKILSLKKMKEEAEIKLARVLFKKMQMILGKDLNLNLVTLLLEETWTQSTSEQKEDWRQQAATFSQTKTTKTL